jgi:hypothetical protein
MRRPHPEGERVVVIALGSSSGMDEEEDRFAGRGMGCFIYEL